MHAHACTTRACPPVHVCTAPLCTAPHRAAPLHSTPLHSAVLRTARDATACTGMQESEDVGGGDQDTARCLAPRGPRRLVPGQSIQVYLIRARVRTRAQLNSPLVAAVEQSSGMAGTSLHAPAILRAGELHVDVSEHALRYLVSLYRHMTAGHTVAYNLGRCHVSVGTISTDSWLTPPGHKTSCIVSTGAQYRAPTSREGTAMKLGPGPKGA